MIRNESKIIKRMIDSTRNVCSHCVITDTGSTDKTVSIVQSMKDYCTLYINPFENFGKSRTQSIHNAIDYCKKQHKNLRNTWLLLLDADMILHKKDSFNPNVFKDKECVMLRQTDISTSYFNVRLIRADIDWKVFGVTHEYTGAVNRNITQFRYDGLTIDDKNDGGFKYDKLERDLRLLLQGLYSCDGIHLRYLFYIAQTYQHLGNRKQAKKFNTLRIQHKDKGFVEEIFLAYYRRGCMQSKTFKMLRDFDLAYEFMPDRIESMIEKTRVLLQLGRVKEAWDTALSKVISKPVPKNKTLFIDLPSYYNKRDELFLNIAIRQNLRNPDILERANKMNILSDDCARYMPYFTRPLPLKPFFNNYEINPIPILGPGFVNSTPSLATESLIAIRYHNYYITPSGDYGCDSRPVKTRTFLYDLLTKKYTEINFLRTWNELAPIQGDEDVRLFYNPDEKILRFTAVNCDHIPNSPRISTGKIDIHTGIVQDYKIWEDKGIQKNWLWSDMHKKHIHGIDTDGYILFDDDNKQLHPSFRLSGGPIFHRNCNGNGNGNGNLDMILLVHIVGFNDPDKKRVYTHRLLNFTVSGTGTGTGTGTSTGTGTGTGTGTSTGTDTSTGTGTRTDTSTTGKYKIQSYSDAFCFEKSREVEYSCGMQLINNKVYISYSVRDSSSNIGWMYLKDLIRISKTHDYNNQDSYLQQKLKDGIV